MLRKIPMKRGPYIGYRSFRSEAIKKWNEQLLSVPELDHLLFLFRQIRVNYNITPLGPIYKQTQMYAPNNKITIHEIWMKK